VLLVGNGSITNKRYDKHLSQLNISVTFLTHTTKLGTLRLTAQFDNKRLQDLPNTPIPIQ